MNREHWLWSSAAQPDGRPATRPTKVSESPVPAVLFASGSSPVTPPVEVHQRQQLVRSFLVVTVDPGRTADRCRMIGTEILVPVARDVQDRVPHVWQLVKPTLRPAWSARRTPSGQVTRGGLTKWGKGVARTYHRVPAPHHHGDPATSPRVPSSSDVEVRSVNDPSAERSSGRSPRSPTDPPPGSSDSIAPLRCLVTGGSGFLGRRLVRRLGRLGVAVGTYHSRPHPDLPMVELDVTQQSQVEALLDGGGFDVCVHAAANRDVEACEDDPRAAVRLNVHATRYVAEACRRVGTRLVYISTDHVFDGLPRGTYDEDDEPRPIQVYGFTKMAGELEALRTPGALCIRAPVLHGAALSGAEDDFPVQVLRKLRIGARIAADDDAVRYPVQVHELAETVARLCAGGVSGVVHFSSAEGVTKYAWARLLAEAFDLDPACVVARPQVGRAARPRDNHLTSNRLAALGLTAPTDVSDAVRALRRADQAA